MYTRQTTSWKNFIFFMVAGVILSSCAFETTKQISVRAGRFNGIVRKLDVFGETKKVEKYLGIPYAETPKLFKKSVIKAPLPFDTVYDATRYGASCSQIGIPLGGVRNPNISVELSDDCLFLNMYKPFTEDLKKTLPVMVYFHGGGFVCGSAQPYSGDLLSAYGEVIVITVNYRLAVWGFLSTGDNTLPGNLGIWDQHIALKWVHENIIDFGGNPDNVAIFGHSCGSSSGVYHSMFLKNKGYFQRVIGISGSITCPWSYQPKPHDAFLRVAEILGCDVKASDERIFQCIQSKSSEELGETLNDPENDFVRFPMELTSVVDGEILKDDPYKVMNAASTLNPEVKEFFASIDFMTGITTGEGGMNNLVFAGIPDTENFAPSREEFEREIVPKATKLMYGESVPSVVSDIIVHKYTNWENPNDKNNIRQSFLDMTGDHTFNFHAKLLADMHANLSAGHSGKTYAYLFEALPSQHIMWTPTWMSKPNHGDELMFLFGYDKEGFRFWTEPFSEDYKPADWEVQLSKLFMTLFTNFVKTG